MSENKKPKLLIVTGPQGSGNHLFAKIFNMHPSVKGWQMEWKEWQGHHQEPFQEYWQDPSKLKDFVVAPFENFVTSISCPYYKDKKPQTPKYGEFISEAKKYFEVKVLIIARDRNILKLQQQRLRGEHTTPKFMDQMENFDDVHFVSHEALYLYQGKYLESLAKQLDFPIAHNHTTLLDDFLKKDANIKYVKPIEKGDFDDQATQSSLIDS
jgi:hypothetical protein